MNDAFKETAAQPAELPALQQQAQSGPAVLGARNDLLQGVKVKLSVVVGEAHTTLGELTNLKELSVLKIDRAADAPVDILLDGNLVARGQLVVVDDNFGIQVTEIPTAAKP